MHFTLLGGPVLASPRILVASATRTASVGVASGVEATSAEASVREAASGMSVFVFEVPHAPATETRTEAVQVTTGQECRIHGTIAGNSMAFKGPGHPARAPILRDRKSLARPPGSLWRLPRTAPIRQEVSGTYLQDRSLAPIGGRLGRGATSCPAGRPPTHDRGPEWPCRPVGDPVRGIALARQGAGDRVWGQTKTTERGAGPRISWFSWPRARRPIRNAVVVGLEIGGASVPGLRSARGPPSRAFPWKRRDRVILVCGGSAAPAARPSDASPRRAPGAARARGPETGSARARR